MKATGCISLILTILLIAMGAMGIWAETEVADKNDTNSVVIRISEDGLLYDYTLDVDGKTFGKRVYDGVPIFIENEPIEFKWVEVEQEQADELYELLLKSRGYLDLSVDSAAYDTITEGVFYDLKWFYTFKKDAISDVKKQCDEIIKNGKDIMAEWH